MKIDAITDNSVEIINKEGKKFQSYQIKFWLQQVANPILLDLDLKTLIFNLVNVEKLWSTINLKPLFKMYGHLGMCMAVYNLLTLPLMISVL